MAHLEHPTVARADLGGLRGSLPTLDSTLDVSLPGSSEGEPAAREALRAQIAKLEREVSGLVAYTFPHIPSHDPHGEALSGPRLLSLAELERVRDRLALRVREVNVQVAERVALQLRSRALLERMKLEPGRYKFVRVPVTDLGDGHCGVWEVRPRLGIIGMLAGWWQVKLSSGCP
ncbi:MAG TPA: hypothetical protein VGI26_03155 [Solirubrobacteraceae bacterium]|jgi:hypothetical protein